jgi:hypothetical protein
MSRTTLCRLCKKCLLHVSRLVIVACNINITFIPHGKSSMNYQHHLIITLDFVLALRKKIILKIFCLSFRYKRRTAKHVRTFAIPVRFFKDKIVKNLEDRKNLSRCKKVKKFFTNWSKNKNKFAKYQK